MNVSTRLSDTPKYGGNTILNRKLMQENLNKNNTIYFWGKGHRNRCKNLKALYLLFDKRSDDARRCADFPCIEPESKLISNLYITMHRMIH